MGVSALALGLGSALAAVAPAHAASTYTVLNTLGSVTDVDSLPWAIEQANANPDVDTIVFVSGLGSTITIIDLMVITEGVIITGPGEGALTIDAPGTVFEITPSAPGIEVTISGLTLTDSAAIPGGCGIDAIETNLTVFDLTANGFDCNGVGVFDGSLDATDVTTNGNGSAGIAFYGDDAADTLALTRVVANDNLMWGVNAQLVDTTATMTTVEAHRNPFGVFVIADASTSTITDAHADDSADAGFGVVAIGGSVVNVNSSSVGALDPMSPTTAIGVLAQISDSSSLTASHLTVSSQELGGMLIDASDGSSVSVQSSLIENNGVSGGCGCGSGGGIYLSSVDNSTVTISGTHVLSNLGEYGGGVSLENYSGLDARLTISDSVISHNEATEDGGGLALYDVGLRAEVGPISVLRTTIANNTAGAFGGGVSIDGFAHATAGTPVVLIDSSTISGNTAANSGGVSALKSADSGGNGLIRLINSTVSGNTAVSDAAGVNTVAAITLSSGEMETQVVHSTIAGNLGDGGLLVSGVQNVTLSHSLFADNAGYDFESFAIAPASVEYSLIETPGGFPIPAAPGNIVGVDPALGPLANNGGPTQTHLIAPGSAAYNAGNPAIAGAPAFDQRGLARIYQTIDIGAVEWHPALAATGSEPEPEPGLVGLLLLFTGLALLAASRRFAL
ncbi:hypothetical protein BH10ACT7_BH10ACT7_06930 [soil metagenome]